MISYDKAVADALLAKFPACGSVKIYHDKAPETGDTAYPYIVYRTLSLSPSFFADNRYWGYQHVVRVTVVGKSGPTKTTEADVMEALEAAGYGWQMTSPTVEDRDYGEKYTAIDFIRSYEN